MKVFVTGASGGLGSHLVESFTARGHRVTGLTRSEASVGHLTSTTADFVLGDVTEDSTLVDDLSGHDCLVHTVARVGGGSRWREHLDTDLAGTANVLNAAVRAGCSRFIHISSIAVLDLPGDGSAADDTTPMRPTSRRPNLYTRSKLEVERLVKQYESEGRIAVTVVRPSVFLGRYDRHTTPGILRFLRSPLAGLVGDGQNLIPCVDLTELAGAVVTAAECERSAGRTYNLSGQHSVPLSDLLGLHAKEIGQNLSHHFPVRGARAVASIMETGSWLLNRKPKPILDRFMVDVATLNCIVNCSRAVEDLNWRGGVDLKDSIRQSIRWHEENIG